MAMDMLDIVSELLDFEQGSMHPEDTSAVYMMQDSAAVLEELACPEFEYGNTDSDSESDDVLEDDVDSDQSVGVTGLIAGLVLPCDLSTAAHPLSDPRRNESLSPSSREEKNNRERVRITHKREKLKEAKDMAARSALIDEEAKRHRWTEEYTLKQLRRMIANAEGQYKKYGRSPRIPRPLARKSAPRGRHRSSNRFLQYSKALRSSFLALLKSYLHPGKTKGELEEIKVSHFAY